MVRCRVLAAALGVGLSIAAAGAAPAAAGGCSMAPGTPVVMRSSDFDPDVLVWDSRARAIAYAGGNAQTAADVLNHTLLSKPGTRAIVVSCLARSVQPKYTDTVLDTVGVKITNGPDRGRYGWVTSDDIRGANTAEIEPQP